MRTKIAFNGIMILLFFCLLNFITCREKNVKPHNEAQKVNPDNNARAKKRTKYLGKEKLKEVAEANIKGLNDKSPIIREDAANALGELKYEGAVEPLIQALKDKNKDVRLNAAWALGEIRSAKAIGPLQQLLKDENTIVKLEAKSALRKIRDPNYHASKHDEVSEF